MQLGSPTNGAHFPVGSNIPLGVVAPTNHISFYHVAYYANGTLLGNTIRAPFSLLWTNPTSGVYAVTAVAGDSQNHTIQSRPISITVTPTNDDFTNRTMITGANLTLTNSLAGATLESGETALGGSDANSIWWSWTAPASGWVKLSFPNGQDFAVYRGSSISNLTQIISGYGEQFFEATAGTPYGICAAGTPDQVILQLMLSTLQITAPVNGAQIIGGRTLEIDTSFTAIDGTLRQVAILANGVALGVATNAPCSVIWSNVPPGDYELTAVGTSIDGIIHTSSGVSISVVPTNDFFANRIILNGSGAFVNGNVACATTEPGDPGLFNNTLWYSWTAPWTGDFALSIDYDYWPSLDAVVFSGANLGSLLQVTYDYPGYVKTLHVAAGTTYQICVASPADAQYMGETDYQFSNFTLNLQPCPLNDNFTNSITITNLSAPIHANNLGATAVWPTSQGLSLSLGMDLTQFGGHGQHLIPDG